jgi:hypothetical protein
MGTLLEETPVNGEEAFGGTQIPGLIGTWFQITK